MAAGRRTSAAGPRRAVPVLAVLVAVLIAWPLVRLVAHPPTLTVAPAVGGASGTGPRVIVVGLPGLVEPDPSWPLNDSAQSGVLAAPGCPAASWASLGSGRPVTLSATRCPIRATDGGVVAGWAGWQAAAPGIGTLGDTLRRLGLCAGAVGPGGALAAAGGDAGNAAYQSLDGFIQGGYLTDCPLTLVDAADRGRALVTALLRQPDTTVVVLGTGGAAGAVVRQAAVIYPAGAAAGGQLVPAGRTAAPLTPAGLAAALIAAAGGAPPPGVVSGWQVRSGTHSGLAAMAARDGGRASVGWTLFALTVLLLAGVGLVLRRGRVRSRWIRTVLRLAAITWPAAALVAAAVPWWPAPLPLGVGAALAGTLVLGAAAGGLARWWRVRSEAAGVVVVAAALALLTAATGLSPYASLAPLTAAAPHGVDPLALGGCLAAGLVLAELVALRRLGDAGRWQPLLVAAVGILGLASGFVGVLVAPGAAAWQVPIVAAVAALPPLVWLMLGSIGGLSLPLSAHVAIAVAALVVEVLLGAPLGAWSVLAAQLGGLVSIAVLAGCVVAWAGLVLLAGPELAIAPAALAVGVLLLGLGPWVVLGVTLVAAGVLVGRTRGGLRTSCVI